MLLVDVFLQQFEAVNKRIQAKRPDRLVDSGNKALHEAVRTGEKLYFSPGTVAMLREHVLRYEEVMREIEERGVLGEEHLLRTGIWIEFHTPIPLSSGAPIAALFVYCPSHYLATGKDRTQLLLIDQFAEIRYILGADRDQAWQHEKPFHRCPNCREEYGVPLYCTLCKAVLVGWSEILVLSMIIAGQYLAERRYEEKVFTGVRRVQREHSHKERSIPVKHLFKVIDANEMIIQIPPAESEAAQKEQHGSWIVDADVIYEERRTRPFIRTYRHPRYVNMRGQTVEFPSGIVRMQPMKVENIGKHVTKVKASSYEEDKR